MQKIIYSLILFSCFMLKGHKPIQVSSQDSLRWYGVTDKKDFIVSTGLSAAFFGGSFLVKDRGTRTIIQTAALFVPLVRFFSTTRVVKRALNSVPVIKEVLGCTALECEGICSECVMRHTMLDTGVVAAIFSLNTFILQSLGKRAELEKKENHEEKVSAKKKECNICYETKEERYCASPKCCNENQIICGTCIGKWIKEKEGSYEEFIKCPFCNQAMICSLPEEEVLDGDIEDGFEIISEAKKEKPLSNDLFSAAFNKTLLISGSGIASLATLFSYADHRAGVKDGALTIACSSLLVALAGKIKDPVKQKQLLAVAVIVPFIGLINKSETIRKIGKSVPFLNHLLGCDKKGCAAICAHCKLRNAQRGTAALIGVSLLSPSLFGRL